MMMMVMMVIGVVEGVKARLTAMKSVKMMMLMMIMMVCVTSTQSALTWRGQHTLDEWVQRMRVQHKVHPEIKQHITALLQQSVLQRWLRTVDV